jgi:hypothetical protein
MEGAIMPKKKTSAAAGPLKLTEAERDLVSQMEHGYQLETDSLGGDPVLRSKDGEVVRPASANRNTVKALEDRGRIVQGKGRDPLKIEWHLNKPRK